MRRRKRRRTPKSKISRFVVQQQRWKLSLLRDFIARHGWAKLKPNTIVRPGVNLHRWVMHRRADYHADRIPDWLVPECEAIAGWSWDVFRDAYVRNVDNLRAFVKQHGWDALATRPVVDGVRLDKWVAHRRDEYRKGELDRWLIRGLEAIPGWTWDPLHARYERNLRELREYVARHGWSSLHEHTISNSGVHVGHWAGAMRAMHRRGEIPEWVAAELGKLAGWTWEPHVARQLAKGELLGKFVAEHGWDAVSNALVVDGVNLGTWINNCRMRYRRGSLLKETIRGLEAIAGWSWSGADTRAQIHRENAERVAARIAALEELRGLTSKPARQLRRISGTTPATKPKRGNGARALRNPKRSASDGDRVAVAIPIQSKRTVLAQLVKLTRAAGAPLPSYEIPFGLYNALLHHFGGIHRARRAAKLPDPPQAREWTQTDAIAEVRRLHNAGLTIRYRDLELAGREDLVGAIRTYVGSIVRARVLANVPHPPRAAYVQDTWDEDRVVEDILDLHRAGQPLAHSRAPSKLVNAGNRYFGSWDNALFAAGLDPDEIRLRRRPYGDDEMIERIRKLAREQPTMNFGELYKHPDGQALWRRFGSIEAGLRAASLSDWPVRVLHDAYTAEEVIAVLKARHRTGKSLRKTAIEEDSRLCLGITRRFKTLAVALSAAGLESVS